jgi:hypothetical protein
VAQAYDAIVPLMLEIMNSQIEAFVDALAIVYARNFTTDELREIAIFYRTPAGQKLLKTLPVVMQETMVLGQKFGEVIAKDLEDKIVKELRKRGHDI